MKWLYNSDMSLIGNKIRILFMSTSELGVKRGMGSCATKLNWVNDSLILIPNEGSYYASSVPHFI